MRSTGIVVILCGLAAWGTGQDTAIDRVVAARSALVRLIDQSGAEAAVVWHPLEARTGEEIRIDATTRFHAASTMKIPVMIELFRQAALGQLRLDDSITVSNQFHSIVDGCPYELSATEDSDGGLTRRLASR
jgi:beta-lactamase class A